MTRNWIHILAVAGWLLLGASLDRLRAQGDTNTGPIDAGISSAPSDTAATNSAADIAGTNAPSDLAALDTAAAPGLGQLPTPGTVQAVKAQPVPNTVKQFQVQLELGREERRQKNIELADKTLSNLLTSDAPDEIKRLALFELALVSQDDGKLLRAEQIFGQYLHNYADDPSSPEVLLRQGLIYRQMGINSLAVSKFYAVMSSALKLKLENMDYYKKLVLQSQIEIADTYFQEGKYDEAADFFHRLLRTGNPDLDQIQTHYKLVRALSNSTNCVETSAQAQSFLDLYPQAPEVPEVRFFFATALKKLGHNNESMKQVLLLLQSQAENVHEDPQAWAYWQQRAGNEIASQLFKDGDYFSALQIYNSLADLDKSPGWQLPVWYQTGLIYEQLQQWDKASDVYQRMTDRQKELTDATSTPAVLSLIDMAKWRKDYISWMKKAKVTQQEYLLSQNTNTPPTTAKQ